LAATPKPDSGYGCVKSLQMLPVAIEACRLDLKYMVPVIILSDGYLQMARSLGAYRVSDIQKSR